MAAAAVPVMIGLSAATTASTFVGQRKAANAAKQQGDYEASMYTTDAGFAQQQAADALQRGREAELATVRSARSLRGSQRAAFAASGVEVDSGSALEVQTSDSALSVLDEMMIRHNAAREAWGFQVQSQDLLGRANLARMGASNTAASYRNAAFGTLLGGAANVYGLGAEYLSSRPAKVTPPKTTSTAGLTPRIGKIGY